MQVYVRRAYMTYDIESLQQNEIGEAHCIVEFAFLLPPTHPNRLMVQRQVQSRSSDTALTTSAGIISCTRKGIMAAFTSFDEFAKYACTLR